MSRSCARRNARASAWRTGIGGQPSGAVAGGDRVEIGSKQRAGARCDRRAHEPVDAVAPFAAAPRLLSGEVVTAGAGMGVDDAERRRFLAQMHEDAHQHRVLDHIGEIAGVKGVAIIHGAKLWAQSHARKFTAVKVVKQPPRASGLFQPPILEDGSRRGDDA